MDLSVKHTFALSAQAQNYHAIGNLTDCQRVEWTPDTWLLGAGSNTIFTDDFDSPLLHNCMRGYAITETDDDYLISLAAGESWHHWVVKSIELGMAGLENLALIPGSVGAAPVQNIGAYGAEISEFVDFVDVYDFLTAKTIRLSAAECCFGYRDSIFKQQDKASWMVTQVGLRLTKHWQPRLGYPDLKALTVDSSARSIMQEVIRVREAKLPNPATLPNAGSFFKNPVVSQVQAAELVQRFPQMPCFHLATGEVKLAAGWLIDQAGLKALHIGDAAVHAHQALVLVNRGKATGQQVLDLARQVRREVYRQFDIQLEPEVQVLGRTGIIAL